MDVRRAILERRSIRSFLATPVPDADLELILDSGRRAPSGSNTPLIYVIVIRDPATKTKIHDVSGFQGPERPRRWQRFILQAPVLLGIALDPYRRLQTWGTVYPKNENEELYIRSAYRDGAMVADHLALQAAELGISSCFMSWYSQQDIRPIVRMPDEHHLLTFLALGYAKGRASKPQVRRTQASFTHYERFDSDRPFELEELRLP